jgi:hypothetical protein
MPARTELRLGRALEQKGTVGNLGTLQHRGSVRCAMALRRSDDIGDQAEARINQNGHA